MSWDRDSEQPGWPEMEIQVRVGRQRSREWMFLKQRSTGRCSGGEAAGAEGFVELGRWDALRGWAPWVVRNTG